MPQNRERIFIVGFKKYLKFSFPQPLNERTRLTNFIKKLQENLQFLIGCGIAIKNVNKETETWAEGLVILVSIEMLNTLAQFQLVITKMGQKIN